MTGTLLTEKEYARRQSMEARAKLYEALMDSATLIAKKRNYDAEDMDAVYVLFAEKLHWTPAQVREMTLEELVLIFNNIIGK